MRACFSSVERLIASVSLDAQSCVARSQQILQVAVPKAGSGDDKQVQPLLQEAEAVCPTSPVIKRRLAIIYREILFEPAKQMLCLPRRKLWRARNRRQPASS